MKNSSIAVFITMVLALISGCAAVPDQKVISNKEANSETLNNINNIALLSIPNPPFYWLEQDNAMSTFFLGAEITTAIDMSQADKNSHLFESFDFARSMQQHLLVGLNDLGFNSQTVQVSRDPEKASTLLKSYNNLDAENIDAYLDVVPIGVGFKKSLGLTFAEADLAPHISVVARLISARTKDVLYSETISYGYAKIPMTTQIELPEGYQDYDNEGEVKANLPKAIGELEEGTQTVANAILAKLSKGADIPE